MTFEEQIEQIITQVVTEESNPPELSVGPPLPKYCFAAKVEDRIIKVFCVGKWRPIRYYTGKKKVITNKKILAEMTRTIWINTGKNMPIKEIKFAWIEH